jgi:hypothetical protein
VEKAKGVFIWVRLVVAELIVAIEARDIDVLGQKLEDLPSDLEELYSRIVEKIPTALRHYTINKLYLGTDRTLLEDACAQRAAFYFRQLKTFHPTQQLAVLVDQAYFRNWFVLPKDSDATRQCRTFRNRFVLPKDSDATRQCWTFQSLFVDLRCLSACEDIPNATPLVPTWLPQLRLISRPSVVTIGISKISTQTSFGLMQIFF